MALTENAEYIRLSMTGVELNMLATMYKMKLQPTSIYRRYGNTRIVTINYLMAGPMMEKWREQQKYIH